jgi:hypothetical protein
LVGYASWSRGVGYGQHAVLEVSDVVAITAEAARELIGVWRAGIFGAPQWLLRPFLPSAVSDGT